MLQLRVIQAEFGDCLILEYGDAAHPRYSLIDGGPQGTYPKHLRAELAAIAAAGGSLERVILSHVDNDHILGLLEMLAELAQQREGGKPGLIAVEALWHNAFARTLGDAGAGTGQLVKDFAEAAMPLDFLPAASELSFGISEGSRLLEAARELEIPVNAGFTDGLITQDGAPAPLALAGGLSLRVVGPTCKNLERLKKDWLAWLEKAAGQAYGGDPVEADKVDRSVPNLSSIMLLAEDGQRRMLLTGDGLGADLLDGLKQANLLDAAGKIHVDVLKLPHHGSVRNINRKFFETIQADVYVVSANGKYNNPDLATLIWLVEAVRQSQRKVRLVATNPTTATSQLLEDYPPGTYGYELVFLEPGKNSIRV
jgi:glyoxylase-like metal-dependent hydrolase (beta-lactamase superfamily II)